MYIPKMSWPLKHHALADSVGQDQTAHNMQPDL